MKIINKMPKLLTLNTLCIVIAMAFIAVMVVACNANGVVTPSNNNTKLLVINTSLMPGPYKPF